MGSPRRLLVVGNLAYHEETITLPILAELQRLGVETDRAGTGFLYFPFDRYGGYNENWYAGIELNRYDAMFLLDWWNPSVMGMLYRMFIQGVDLPIVGLFHGSIHLEGDPMIPIRGSQAFEKFMIEVLDKLIVPAEWLGRYLPSSAKYEFIGYPIDVAVAKETQRKPTTKRVLFTSRWSHDKGNDRFVAFAKKAKAAGIECIATGEGKSEDITFTGWLTKSELVQLAKGGGYVWGASRQEAFPYAIWESLAVGLHPLFHDKDNYNVFNPPPTHVFSTYDQAIQIVLEGRATKQDYWISLVEKHGGNAQKIAKVLYEQMEVQS